MTDYRFTIWLQSPIGRRVNRALHRFGPWQRWTARKVWAEIERDPVFMAGIEAGKADLAAGRFAPYRRGES